ncbi:unnamed protein product [Cuscuta epithymum]|uniref:Uncharacterized protein n=1 Tax=Cuscuta epithymum TaxID=186058 RepID=A0AAV0FUD5_9ASTE|nr:unnamed protein product [Cuscuta epithymum]
MENPPGDLNEDGIDLFSPHTPPRDTTPADTDLVVPDTPPHILAARETGCSITSRFWAKPLLPPISPVQVVPSKNPAKMERVYHPIFGYHTIYNMEFFKILWPNQFEEEGFSPREKKEEKMTASGSKLPSPNMKSSSS